jgi:hypothetical protein
MFAARRGRAIRAGAWRRHGQCPAARSQYLNLPDSEEMLEFQRESGARHCRAAPFALSDGLASVGASSTAAVVRDGVERLERLLLSVQPSLSRTRR